MSNPYHKIPRLFKALPEGHKRAGKADTKNFTTPELAYLANNKWEFTEKVDGTNIRIQMSMPNDRLSVTYGGRTDNAVITSSLRDHLRESFPTDPMWRESLKMRPFRERHEAVRQWMIDSELKYVTLYGEGYGASIHGGGKYRDDTSFVLFDVKIGDWWLRRDDVNDIASKMGIDSVPVVAYGTLQDAVDIVTSGIVFNKDGYMKTYGRGGLRSQWGDFEAEGLVGRPTLPLFDRSGKRIITKIRGRDFK